MQLHTLTIVGVGLIGGSIGLGVKKRSLARHVIGVGRSPDKLQEAQRLGAIDSCSLTLADGVRHADFVIFCTPVDQIAEQIKSCLPHLRDGAILTDAGSTKEQIIRAVESDLPAQVHFVGGHPLAGSEKQGVRYANADLFVKRWTVLTPTDRTSADALQKVEVFWQALGARTRIMPPREHDDALALTSHLPHLLASALAGILPTGWRDLTASGFRDSTRIAAGDPAVWTPIFEHNRPALLAALGLLEARLLDFRQALASGALDTIDQLLAQGKKVRDALGS